MHNITRVSLRQSCLIFSFPGKKIPALHRQQAGFRSYRTPSQRSMLRSSTSQHALNFSLTSQHKRSLPNVCQHVRVYHFLPASERVISIYHSKVLYLKPIYITADLVLYIMDTKSTLMFFYFYIWLQSFCNAKITKLPYNRKEKGKIKCAYSVLIILQGSKLHSQTE